MKFMEDVDQFPRDIISPPIDFRGPWFNSKVAAAYVGNKNVRAYYSWCTRHFIVRRSNGTVAKADLDRALKARKGKRKVHPNTLANLRKRWDRRPSASRSTALSTSREALVLGAVEGRAI